MRDTIYAVTRIHNQEQHMLSRADVDRLAAAATAEEALRFLHGKGWGSQELPGGADALIAFERERAWALVNELVDDARPFDILRLDADYHNLKAAIKLAYTGRAEQDAARHTLSNGAIEPDVLIKAAATRDFSALPPEMAAVARRAWEALMHTHSGQAADIILDAGALLAIDRAGKASRDPLIQTYARIRVDGALVKIAARAAGMGQGRDFLETAIPADAGSLNRAALIGAALSGRDAVYEFLRETPYADAVAAKNPSPASLERWFDDHLMEQIRPQRYVYEGIGPIAAYLIAREREIEAVRLILSAKANHLSGELVAERLRALYV